MKIWSVEISEYGKTTQVVCWKHSQLFPITTTSPHPPHSNIALFLSFFFLKEKTRPWFFARTNHTADERLVKAMLLEISANKKAKRRSGNIVPSVGMHNHREEKWSGLGKKIVWGSGLHKHSCPHTSVMLLQTQGCQSCCPCGQGCGGFLANGTCPECHVCPLLISAIMIWNPGVVLISPDIHLTENLSWWKLRPVIASNGVP